MSDKYETVKGFRDFLGEEAEKREVIRSILVSNFEKYGYEASETPIVEYREFVQGENKNDEAVSDIFKLKDRGERELALRYEFTFQLKRIMRGMKLPYKRYSIGPVFRDEPIKGNRFRQFIQADIDTVGSSVKDEAELLAVTKRILDKLGIEFVIYVNNRKLLNEILLKENILPENFEKVIREIDKLDKIDRKEIYNNLKEMNAQNLLEIFEKPSSFFEKYENYKSVKELINNSNYFGVKVIFSSSLARGLSYYNGNVFEVKSKTMKETIIAGGSYMFNNVQSSGISFGLDRLSVIAKVENKKEKIMVLSLGEEEKSAQIAEKLRTMGANCFVFFDKVSKALEYANAKKISKVVFVGSNEVASGKLKVKDMQSGKEKFVEIKKLKEILK